MKFKKYQRSQSIILLILSLALILPFFPTKVGAQEPTVTVSKHNVDNKAEGLSYFTSPDGFTVYCGEDGKPAPMQTGESIEIGVSELKVETDPNVIKILYYGYGGPEADPYLANENALRPGLIMAGPEGNVHFYQNTHFILSDYLARTYGYNNGITYFNGKSKDLYNYALAKPEVKDPNFKVYSYYSGESTQRIYLSKYEEPGSLELTKATNDEDSFVKDLPMSYSLEGAQYTLYGDKSLSQKLGVFTIGANGKSNIIDNLDPGTYYIKETKAPKGFAMDPTAYPVHVKEGEKTSFTVKDSALFGKLDLIIQKASDVKDAKQSLAGAEFKIQYYDGHREDVSDLEAKKTWYFKTDDQGRVLFNEDYLISGDPLYKDGQGQVLAPIGTYTIEEIKAPSGFILNNETYYTWVEESGTDQLSNGVSFEPIHLENELIRGHISGKKLDKESSKALEGVEVSIFRIANGERVAAKDVFGQVLDPVITDKDGYFEFKNLPVGTYLIKETKALPAYVDQSYEKTFEINKNNQKQTQNIQILNQAQLGRIELYKKGKVLTGFEEGEDKQVKLIYEDKYLPDTKWLIEAGEDIYFPDGSLAYQEGDQVQILTTTSTGPVRSKDLPFGKYKVREIGQLKLYTQDSNIYEVNLSSQDAKEEIVSKTLNRTNQRKELKVEFTKIFERSQYFNHPMQAEFGLFLGENYVENGVRIPKDSLLATVQVDLAEEKEMLEDENSSEEAESISEGNLGEANIGEDANRSEDIAEENTSEKNTDVEGFNKTIVLHFPALSIDGDFYIKELSTSDSYTLNEEILPFSIDFSNYDAEKITYQVEAEFENFLQRLSLQLLKFEKGSQRQIPVPGAIFDLFARDEEKGDQFIGQFKTDEAGQILVENLEKGLYYFVETVSGEDYILDGQEYQIQLEEDGQELIAENVKIPTLKTTLLDRKDGEKDLDYKSEVVLVDIIEYEDLIVGQEYVIKGQLIRKSDQEVLDENEIRFIPEERNGQVEMEFSIHTDGLEGDSLVAFESLYFEDECLTKHEDLEDEKQTIHIPKIRTKAHFDEAKEIFASEKMTLTDTVSFENLIPGKTYRLEGILMDKNTGQALLIHGEEVRSQLEFVPKEASGQVDLVFEFDGRELANKEIVVFEDLYRDQKKLASHADINDEGQTVRIKEVPVEEKPEIEEAPLTGDSFDFLLVSLSLLASLIFLLVIYRTKKQK